MLRVTRKSPLSGAECSMELDITLEQYKRWRNGELIQNVMPDLTAGEREFLITGINPVEWEKTFGKVEK